MQIFREDDVTPEKGLKSFFENKAENQAELLLAECNLKPVTSL